MDEDLARFRALTRSFAETIVKAYSQRFPEPTAFEINVVFSSLTAALISFLLTLPQEDRNKFIISLVNTLMEARDE